uniref:CHCH domain-containing protein n=1 Tax=Caenorhabditis tropicalis TaxID=1561998 RepID=A0A1I7TBA9_9PELO
MPATKDEVIRINAAEYWGEIKDDYAKRIVHDSEEIYPSNNPGPETPDGKVNFECHCVGHLVGSPCGFEFREAMSCQKSSNQEQLEENTCEKELLSFMECVTRTQCFTPAGAEEKKT